MSGFREWWRVRRIPADECVCGQPFGTAGTGVVRAVTWSGARRIENITCGRCGRPLTPRARRLYDQRIAALPPERGGPGGVKGPDPSQWSPDARRRRDEWGPMRDLVDESVGVLPDRVVALDDDVAAKLEAAVAAGAQARADAIEAIRVATFEHPQARSHSEWSQRINDALTGYLDVALRAEETMSLIQLEHATTDWHRHDCATVTSFEPCDCPAGQGFRVYLLPPKAAS